MAKAFPTSQFDGYDFHSIEHAQAHAREHGVSANTRFGTATAKEYPGSDFDLVTFFDCLHDMADPAGAAPHVRRSLKPDGSWRLSSRWPATGSRDNLNPVGRLYYGASTMV
jgi:ubiquinone/menaquinone biosynthesis C-methylase UbiE